MRGVLITGMSGAGKSTALDRWSRRGFRVIDTDEPGWTMWDEQDDGYVWREDRIAELLAVADAPTLFVSGTVWAAEQAARGRSRRRGGSG